MRVYRWDLDKTYLDTDFHSVRGLVRSAIEPAEAKRNIPGSGALLRALSNRPENRIAIVSGSPVQMREVLSRKLQLDGVRVDEFHLKDTLSHIKRGRIRAVKEQFGYKLPLLFRGRKGYGQGVMECLFGDDAEVDALIYSVYADAVAGRLSPVQVSRIMEASGSYPDQIAETLEYLQDVPTAEAVERIFIHLDLGMPTARFEPLGDRLVAVHSWVQAAILLTRDGHLSPEHCSGVVKEVIEIQGGDDWALAGWLEDLVRRGLLSQPEAIAAVAWVKPPEGQHDLLRLLETRFNRLASISRDRNPRQPGALDYLHLVGQFKVKPA